MVEHVQGARHIDFKRRGQPLRFLFLLHAQSIVQVFQNRDVFRPGIVEVRLIDDVHRTVDERLFNGLQAISPADNQLTERKNEVRLEGQRVFLLGVVEVDVHRIDVAAAGGRNADDLSAERVDQREILALGIADDDVVVGQENDVADFALGGERFAGTRRAQNQAVGVLQLFPVHHDQVVGKGVQPAVQGLAAGLEEFLRGKGHKNGGGAGGQAALDANQIVAKWQARHHAILLLEIQRNQLAVVLLRQALRLLDIECKLLFVVRRVHHQEGDEKHALVAALQIFQQFLGLAAIGGQVAGDDVHVVSGAHSLLLLFNLHLVQVRDLALDIPDCRNLVNRADVQGYDEAGFHREEIRQTPVVQVRGQNGEETDLGLLFAHPEGALVAEVKARRRDEVLGGQPRRRKPFPVEEERRLRIHVEHVVHELEPFPAVKREGGYAQPLEVVQQIDFNALKPGLRRFDALGFNAEGDELGLGQAVIALGLLGLQHVRILMPDLIVAVLPVGDQNALLKDLFTGREIEKRELQMNAVVKVIEEIAPALKDGGLVIVLGQLIVDVLKADGLGVVLIGDAADPVRPHALIGDRRLCSARPLPLLLRSSGHERLELLLFRMGQPDFFSALCHEGFSSPPACCGCSLRWLHRSFRSGKCACSDGQSGPACSAAGALQAAGRAVRTWQT